VRVVNGSAAHSFPCDPPTHSLSMHSGGRLRNDEWDRTAEYNRPSVNGDGIAFITQVKLGRDEETKLDRPIDRPTLHVYIMHVMR